MKIDGDIAGVGDNADVVFIDAGHEYYQVKSDVENSLKLWKNITIIFDDYGLPQPHGDIKRVVDEKIKNGELKFNVFIGEKPEDLISASGTKFNDIEGCICNA